MKATKSKIATPSSLHIQQKANNEPFFKKGGDAMSDSEKSNDHQPFFVKRPTIQTKLTIGKPNDKYEVEADQVADQVVQKLAQNDTNTPTTNTNSPSLQAKCNDCEQEEKVQKKEEDEIQEKPQLDIQAKAIFESKEDAPPVQTKPLSTPVLQTQTVESAPEEELQQKEEEVSENELDVEKKPIFESNAEPPPEENDTVQTKSDSDENTASPDLQSRLNSSKGGGQALNSSTREGMEAGFGADFSGVRIHTNSQAVKMSSDLGAKAFTHGNDIYFNEGNYSPETTSGKTLLAHELTHTIQQGASVNKKPEIQRDEEEDLAAELAAAEEDQVQAIDPIPAQEARNEAEEESEKTEEAIAEQSTEEAAPSKENTKSAEEKGNVAKPKQSKPDTVEPTEKSEEKGEAGQFLDQQSENVCNDAAEQTQELADNEQAHDEAGEKLEQTESAVEAPPEEAQSRSNADQVETVEETEAPASSPEDAQQQLNQAIENSIPSDIDDMNKFESEGRGQVVGSTVLANSTQEVGEIQGTYSEIENAPTAAPSEPATALPDIETAPETPEMNLGEGAVPELEDEHTDLSEYDKQSEELVEKEGITNEQLEMVDSGDLAEAKEEKKDLKKKVEEKPAEVKAFAQEKQKKVEKDMLTEEQKDKAAMKAKRKKELDHTNQEQQKAKSEMELKREKVTQHINQIYETAKANVTKRLENLEKQSLLRFDRGQAKFSKMFEREVKADINAWKKKRYSGFWAGVKWLRDKLLGISDFPEVQNAFTRARERYVSRINQLILDITTDSNQTIEDCKAELAKAKEKIKEYVDGLGPDLRKTGLAAQADMKKKLAEMDSFIDKKKEELQQKLCDKKEAAIKAIDEKIEQMKSEMGGLLSLLGKLLLEAAKKFFKWAIEKLGGNPDTILRILDKGATVLKAIFTDPIGFFVNIGKAVGGGINRFVANIKKHLINGLVSWLTGAMGDSGLELPEKFDLKGILSIGLQVMGLTWNVIRTKLVKRLGPKGEAIVGAAEGAIDIVKRVRDEGPIALWNIIKEKAAELKGKVMEGIRNWVITQVVKKAVTKLLMMLNPAGAIIQAITMLYDVVMFFIENWQSILDFVNSIFDSIGEIAKGAIGKAAAFIEKTLAMGVPLIISFLARFIGLGGIGKAIKNIIKKIRKPFQKVLDKVIKFLVKKMRKLFGKGGKKKKNNSDSRSITQKKQALNESLSKANKLLTNKELSISKIKKDLKKEKKRNKLKRLELVILKDNTDEQEIQVLGEVNPAKSTPKVKKPKTLTQLVSLKKPINYKHRNTWWKFKKKSLRKKYPKGVKFNKLGFPDFSTYALHIVKIKMKGNRSYGKKGDFGNANEKAGFKRSKRHPKHTWHHHQDRKTMLLVPRDFHGPVKHSGGVWVIKELGEKT